MSSQPGSNSFFGALFDFSFSEFVTTRIIKVLYVLGMIGVTLWSLVFLFAGLSRGGGAAFFALLFSVLGFFVGLIYLRVLLEFIVIVFRIAENTSVIARNTGGGLAATQPGPATGPHDMPPPNTPGPDTPPPGSPQ